jgi:hypothetical protein
LAEIAEDGFNAETAETAEILEFLRKLCVFVSAGIMPRFVAGLPLTGAEGAESAETVFNAETAEPAESFSTVSAHLRALR